MSKAQEMVARARRTATEARADATEAMSGAVASYLIGSMQRSGALAQIPSPMGLPKTVVLAVAGKLIAYNTSGKVRQVANGAGNAAAHIAIYQFAHGGPDAVAGTVGRVARLDRASDRAIGRGRAMSAEEELRELERAAS